MARYNWQQKDCPRFTFSLAGVEDELLTFSEKVGRVSGIMEALPEETKQDVIVDIILAEAIKASEIEGEYPNRKDVLSSIRKNLGLHHSSAALNKVVKPDCCYDTSQNKSGYHLCIIINRYNLIHNTYENPYDLHQCQSLPQSLNKPRKKFSFVEIPCYDRRTLKSRN